MDSHRHPLRQLKEAQFSSVAQSYPTLCDPMNRTTPGLPVHHQLLEFTLTSIESVMPSSHLILCHPFLLQPPIPPSIRVFSNESTHSHRPLELFAPQTCLRANSNQELLASWTRDDGGQQSNIPQPAEAAHAVNTWRAVGHRGWTHHNPSGPRDRELPHLPLAGGIRAQELPESLIT